MEVEFSISRAISDGNHPLRKWDGEELEQIAPDLLRRDELSRIAFEYFDDKYCGEEWLDQMTSFDTLKDERGDYFCFAANDRGVAYYEQIDKLRIIYNDYDVRFCEDESYFYIDFLDGGGEYSKEEYTLAEAIAAAAAEY